MTGSQERGIATDNSTAAPKLIVSPLTVPAPAPPKKITRHSTIVRRNRAAMAIVLILPRFVTPTAIHRMISAPITIHHTQAPAPKVLFAARAPS